MIDPFILNSKIDIPFVGASVAVHQPSLEEIAYIGGQDVLFPGCELLRISKNILTENDKVDLDNIENFDILMQIISIASPELRKPIENAKLVLQILFPQYEIKWSPPFEISLRRGEELCSINRINYDELREIISEMFCLNKTGNGEKEYDPLNPMAARIIKQLKEREKKLAQLHGNQNVKTSIFDRYISILSVGLQKDKNELIKYSVYQLFDEFERYQAKVAYDIYVQAKMAGAKDIEDVDNWMKDLHSKSTNDEFY